MIILDVIFILIEILMGYSLLQNIPNMQMTSSSGLINLHANLILM